jgi:hypothetical protein
MMTPDNGHSFAVAESLLDPGRVDNIRKKQCQQLNPMFALELFNLRESLERNLLEIPVSHAPESTRLSGETNPNRREECAESAFLD